MKPQRREMNYEKVDCNDFVQGVIADIMYEPEHKFSFQGNEKTGPAVRFKFLLKGYQYPHYSRWMYFSYGEKTTLFTKYISALVEGAEKDMDFDLAQLKGMEVKMLWKEKNDFQSVDTIRPLGNKIVPNPDFKDATEPLAETIEDTPDDSEVPF